MLTDGWQHSYDLTQGCIIIMLMAGETLDIFILTGIFKKMMFFAGPKRGRPTPGFSIFIRSDGPTDRRTDRDLFVSLDQILVPKHSLRDIGTKGQRDKGTKGQRLMILFAYL